MTILGFLPLLLFYVCLILRFDPISCNTYDLFDDFIETKSMRPELRFDGFNLTDELMLEQLRDKMVVFVGDSTTRYQYLNLVYFLNRKKWVPPYLTDPELSGSVCQMHSFPKIGGWDVFNEATNSGLHGNEMCDCFRSLELENRLYYNKELNATVALWWFGRTRVVNIRPYDSRRWIPTGDENGTGAAAGGGPSPHGLLERNMVCHKNETEELNDYTATLPSCPFASGGDVSAVFEGIYRKETSLGIALYNISKIWRPDVLLFNSGHHTPLWTGGGYPGWVTRTVREYLSLLKSENTSVRVVWKETTPVCGNKVLDPLGGHRICHKFKFPHLEPEKKHLLGAVLGKEGLFEHYDTSLIVKSIYDEALRRFILLNSTATPDSPAPPMEAVWYDQIHLNCWVNAQLNRALVAQFFPPV